MFKIGDEVVLVSRDYPITKLGDVGTIVGIRGRNFLVKFHTMKRDKFVGHEFHFSDDDLGLWEGEVLTPIERKIKRMYERQSYFLRYRSGQPAS